MTDLELRLIHCEKEPSQVALYDAADAYREIDDLEMYYALKYMADNRKHPLHFQSFPYWYWSKTSNALPTNGEFSGTLPMTIMLLWNELVLHDTYELSARWLGKRLIELGMV